MFLGQMPDITPMQAIGIIALVFLGVAKSQTWIDSETFDWLVVAVLGKTGADVALRGARNVSQAAKTNLQAAQLQSLPTDAVDQAPAGQP